MDNPTILPRPAQRRTAVKALIMWLRRMHLYTGLLMLPWVGLYGITAILFNHPFLFSDQPSMTFGTSDLLGTPMEKPPKPSELAKLVVDGLRERRPEMKFDSNSLDQARFNREFAFATVKTADLEISLLFEANGAGGTIRQKPLPALKPVSEPAPFTIAGKAEKKQKSNDDTKPINESESLRFPDSLVDRVKATVPIILEKHGLPQGEVTVTSVPDVVFRMNADGVPWKVTHNATTGSVTATKAELETPPEPISTRRFLTRLHLAHGYPFEMGSRWIWAVIVDAMAIVMLFWGFSGLFMWWQIKATRRLGAILLTLSLLAAIVIGFGMYGKLTQL